MSTFSVSWVDLLTVILFAVGISRGRKRGMSEELLDVGKWFSIVLVSGFFYEPLGRFLSEASVFSLLWCYRMSYVLLALFVALIFSIIRSQVGEKLVGSDAFGSGEYYLGMAAGAGRYLCILFAGLALLNARYYTAAEMRSNAQYQAEYFGDLSFPSIAEVQQEVFRKSWTGRLSRTFLGPILIRPTSPEQKSMDQGRSVVRAREREINNVMK